MKQPLRKTRFGSNIHVHTNEATMTIQLLGASGYLLKGSSMCVLSDTPKYSHSVSDLRVIQTKTTCK